MFKDVAVCIILTALFCLIGDFYFDKIVSRDYISGFWIILCTIIFLLFLVAYLVYLIKFLIKILNINKNQQS